MGATPPRRRRLAALQEPVQRGDGGEARLWHLGTALAVSFTVAVVGLAGLAWLASVLLGLAGYRQHGAPALKDTVSVLQLVFATVADVLCAYLRLPYDPDPGDDVDPGERTAYRANREVHHTVIRLIGAHLRPGAAVSWQGLNFDFTGVVFDGGDFSRARFSNTDPFSSGIVLFTGAEFSGGEVGFDGAEFSGGTVGFSGASPWSHPPMFGWDGEPPSGVVLPAQQFEEGRDKL